jgi:YggT family protein
MAGIINFLFTLLIVAFIGQAVISWLFVAGIKNPFLLQLNQAFSTITAPILTPLRKWIPPIGGSLDITPMLAVFGLFFIRNITLSLI